MLSFAPLVCGADIKDKLVKLAFTKMQGLGNDFVVFDAVRQRVDLSATQCRALADRHFGIGCDQILLVEKPTQVGADFRYRIFNADGSEVQQCGNGARCFVRFVHDVGLTVATEICVETAGGLIYPRLEANGQVSVNMGAPRFEPHRIPFVVDQPAPFYPLSLADGETVEITALSMGNPHAVQVVANVEQAPVVRQGMQIEQHPQFPERVNAGFMQVLSRHEIALRVFERGAGETLACGTGACAAVAAGITRGLLDHDVLVHTRGGDLRIQWPGGKAPLWMSGPAVSVFNGEVDVAALSVPSLLK